MSAARLALAAALTLAAACQGKPTGGAAGASAATRLLAAEPALAVRLDLARARTWPLYDKAVALAMPDAAPLLARVKAACGLDVLGALQSLVVARTGLAGEGDVGVVARGLPRAQVTTCLTAFTPPGGAATATVDGDLVHLAIGGAPVASAAFLPGDELVIVSRGGKGVEPAAWKAEVAARGPAPAWALALPADAPIAVRLASPQRTIVAGATLADPLVVTGTVTTATPEAATADVARGKAIISFLEQSNAGTGTLVAAGNRVEAELTARGPQIEGFLATVLPALFGAPAPAPAAPAAPPVVVDPGAPPPACADVGPAAGRYLDATLAKMDPGRRATMEPQLAAIRPRLEAAYVDSCAKGAWPAEVIACHVTYATELSRFERCRLLLADGPRAAFDAAVTAALGM